MKKMIASLLLLSLSSYAFAAKEFILHPTCMIKNNTIDIHTLERDPDKLLERKGYTVVTEEEVAGTDLPVIELNYDLYTVIDSMPVTIVLDWEYGSLGTSGKDVYGALKNQPDCKKQYTSEIEL